MTLVPKWAKQAAMLDYLDKNGKCSHKRLRRSVEDKVAVVWK